jgi:hypothetical protein
MIRWRTASGPAETSPFWQAPPAPPSSSPPLSSASPSPPPPPPSPALASGPRRTVAVWPLDHPHEAETVMCSLIKTAIKIC